MHRACKGRQHKRRYPDLKMCPAGSSTGAAALVSKSNSKPASSSGSVAGDQAFSCNQCRCSVTADTKRLVYGKAFQGTACSN